MERIVETRTCQKCRKLQPIDVFTIACHRLKIRNKTCNECRNRDNSSSPLSRRKLAAVQEGKNRPCKDCGQQYPPVCMDFDHRHGAKSFNLSSGWRWKSLQQIQDEIAKCDVVCANCHRLRSEKDRKQGIRRGGLAPRGSLAGIARAEAREARLRAAPNENQRVVA